MLDESRLTDEIEGKKLRAKGRPQRTTENGETLKYIELVLRQLRRASRDHRQLVEQRNRSVDAGQSVHEFTDPRFWRFATTREPNAREDTWQTPRVVSRQRKIRATDDPRELAQYSGFDAATKLLAKRKTYASVLHTVIGGGHQQSNTGRHGSRYVPAYETPGIDAPIIR